MAHDPRPDPEKPPQEVRLAMRHEACGGRADLIISVIPGNIIYKVHCYECGYTESWLADQATRPRIQ